MTSEELAKTLLAQTFSSTLFITLVGDIVFLQRGPTLIAIGPEEEEALFLIFQAHIASKEKWTDTQTH